MYYRDLVIGRGQLIYDLAGPVGRRVVDNHYRVPKSADLTNEAADVVTLVVRGNDDNDFGSGHSPIGIHV
jgi:hypothetical protein